MPGTLQTGYRKNTICDMAKQFKQSKFLVIEATEAEFAAIGFGFPIQFVGRVIVCDNCNEQINGETCYFIPVLNRVFCKECFDHWNATAEHFSEDDSYEKVHYDGVKNKLIEIGVWEDE